MICKNFTFYQISITVRMFRLIAFNLDESIWLKFILLKLKEILIHYITSLIDITRHCKDLPFMPSYCYYKLKFPTVFWRPIRCVKTYECCQLVQNLCLCLLFTRFTLIEGWYCPVSFPDTVSWGTWLGVGLFCHIGVGLLGVGLFCRIINHSHCSLIEGNTHNVHFVQT